MTAGIKLFRWWSSALKEYAQGNIIAIGVDVEEARSNARAQWLTFAAERWPWLFEDDVDEYDAKERDDKTAQFEVDIAAEPEVGTAFLLRGSE